MKKKDISVWIKELDKAYHDILVWMVPTMIFCFGVIICLLVSAGLLIKLIFAFFATYSSIIFCDKISKYTELLK